MSPLYLVRERVPCAMDQPVRYRPELWEPRTGWLCRVVDWLQDWRHR